MRPPHELDNSKSPSVLQSDDDDFFPDEIALTRSANDLTDDEILAALDMPDHPAPAPVAVQAKSSEFLSDDDLSAVADLERRQLPDWGGLFRRVKDEKAAKRKLLLLPQRRRKTAARVRKHRADPKSVLRLHLTTLVDATSTANGDKFLWTLIGREKEIVRFWVVQSDARRKFGAKASLSKIADHYRLHVGRPMNKNEAHRLSRIVAKLEGPNGVWHRFK